MISLTTVVQGHILIVAYTEWNLTSSKSVSDFLRTWV